MSTVLRFDEPGSDEKGLVGGKAANLGLCAQEGLPVPPGFTVTTEAYGAFLEESGLISSIEEKLGEVDFEDAKDVEARSAEIREAILASALPDALAAEIESAYAALGDGAYVAVRSSGTAEDLAEASFAGMHDTYLHIHGNEGVVAAVRRCWASLWTGRATAYREQQGLNDAAEIRMAVLVQTMVDSEVSGVMFTGNPINTATDELVINASWGLGEAVVQGFVTPDEFVVKAQRPLSVGFEQQVAAVDAEPPLRLKHTTLGTKEKRMVRDPQTGKGTVTEEVPDSERAAVTLSDEQVLELAALGRRVQAFYEDMPQDIEWALADGQLYLLQARPITGVEFDWAAELESFQWAPDDEDALWITYGELLTGAKSPLYYHWMADANSAGYYGIGNMLGIPELMGPAYTNHDMDINRPARHQAHKYYRGEVYFNTEVEKLLARKTFLPGLRAEQITQWLTPDQSQEIHSTPFSYRDFVKAYAQLMTVSPESGLFKVLDRVQEFIDTVPDDSRAHELPDPTTLTDRELKESINEHWLVTTIYTAYCMILYFVYTPQMFELLGRMIARWYTGSNENAYAELCQGVDVRSKTLEENLGLYDLSEEIRNSEELSALFDEHKDGDFFGACENSEAGRAFLGKYRAFVLVNGHRGHEDRDLYYPRRFEDPSIDVRSFQLLLSRENPVSPYEMEEQLTARREEALEDVIQNVKQMPIVGSLKADAIKIVYMWCQRFLAIRDDERWAYECSTMCAKLLCREVGRRCAERGLLDDQEDFLMFSRHELFHLLDGRAGPKLARAKAAARRRDHDRSLERTHEYPTYLRHNKEVPLSTVGGEEADGLIGTGWTSGTITATARVVNRLSEIDRVKSGEILVCQSTDPGWTPVFMLLSGIVIETGGVLAHAVCLAREYALPAVQLPRARTSIPDGATITINGSTGEITIVESEDSASVEATANGRPAQQEVAEPVAS